ncbi:MAG: hypothetical protein HC939_20505 [Pleurocapsa sp. SU_5_0]|nr:hypothetical protein [Pleurocapsa sp. SU_5_0]NJO98474.1 hypothetical protein [Pleurocapsa sp. CRU_1_2]
MNSKKNNKLIHYKLCSEGSPDVESLITYMQEYKPHVSTQQKITQAISNQYLGLAIPKDHKYFHQIVWEAMASHYAAISILENRSGMSFRPTDISSVQSSPIYLPNATYSPVAQPAPQPVPVFTSFVQEAAVESAPTESELPKLTPFEELEAAINEFSQQWKSGTDTLGILNSLIEMQPDNEDDWTEAMWDIYEEFRKQLSNARYETTYDPQQNFK